jgi:tetratricopeptide (TPR) repeat protein
MSENEERFQQAMNQGHSAAWDQLWEQAAAYYRQALNEIPENPKALTSLGLALYEIKQFKEALGVYQQAVNADPNDPLPLEKVGEINEFLDKPDQACQAYLKAAELYAKNRDLDKAVETWQRVTVLQPDHLTARSRLALVYERTGRKSQAVSEYLVVAGILQRAGQIPKAIQTLTHALKIVPDSNEAARALSLIKAGKSLPIPVRPKPGPATPIKEQPLQLKAPAELEKPGKGSDPISEARRKALHELADLLFEQSDGEAGYGTAGRRGLGAIMKGDSVVSRQTDQTKILLHVGQAIDFQTREKSAEAKEELERAIDAGLESAAANFDLGLLMTKSGRLESALRYLQRSLKHRDYSLATRLLIAQNLHKMNRFKEAAVEYLEALRLADMQILSETQAEDLSQLYDPIIEEQRQQDDENQQARLCKNISGLLLRDDWREHLESARQQLPAAMEGGPPTPLAEIITEGQGSRLVEAVGCINQYARMGYYRAAMDEAFYALQHAPTYLPLHIQIGELLMQQNRLQTAIDKFTVIAHSYSVRGEPKRAVEIYRRIIDLSPMDMHARNLLIDQVIALGKPEQAVEEYLSLAEVYYNLADLIMARQTYQQALQLAQQSNVDRKWKVKILHRIADIDLQCLDWRQALRVFDQIRSMMPEDAKARSSLIELNFRLGQAVQALAEVDNYVAYMWSNGQKDKAIKFLEGILEENPKQAGIMKRLAELYRQVGRTTEAIGILDSVGDILLELGDRAGAIETVRIILSMNPPNAVEYQQLLTQIKSS